MSDVKENRKTKRWFEDGLRFACTAPECVHCCTGRRGPGYVWVDLEEIRLLAEQLELEFDQFTRKYIKQVGLHYALVEKPNGDCVFLDHNTGCTVYPARPVQCRTYPFWPELLSSPRKFAAEAEHCPGIKPDAPLVPGEIISECLSEMTGVEEEE